MSHAYQVRLYDTEGDLQAIFDNFVYLEIEHKLNDISTHRFDIAGNDSRRELFTTDSIVEVRRRDSRLGIDWYREYVGFHRTPQRELTENQKRKFISYGRSPIDLIHRRFLLYYAGTSKAGPGDSVIVEYVDENAGPGATSPPRLYPGVTTGLTVQAAAGTGDQWDGERSWRNLLDVIQEIGKATDVDFDVRWDGGQNFTFYTKHPRLGTDRTAGTTNPAIFSTHFGNMINPSYTHSRTEEANTIIVLGQGQEEDRETLLVQGGGSTDSPWNKIELTHDARQQEGQDDLLSEGQEKVAEVKAKESFTFQVQQIPSLAYGKDYFIGDLVTAVYEDISRNIKIVGARITVSEGRETITVEFEE